MRTQGREEGMEIRVASLEYEVARVKKKCEEGASWNKFVSE